MMAASKRAATEIVLGIKILFQLIGLKYFCRLTCNDKSVDGNTVVFVLFVGVSASQTKSCQKSSEEIKQKTDDDKGSGATDVA